MAYTYDITTSIGQVRRLISDTDITPTTDAQFNDEEIQFFLNLASGSVLGGASYALESWASTLSGDLSAETIGDYSYKNNAVANKIALAKKYRDEDGSLPVTGWGSMDLSDIGKVV